jgi:hypothetical protein
MSFYTTLSFYRPTKPPKLKGGDLAEFVTMFASLGLTKEEGIIGYGIKFGRSIDQDEKPISSEGPSVNGISVISRIRYDAEGDFKSLAELAEALKEIDGTIYRASVSLGLVTDSIFESLRRLPSEANDLPLTLDSWSLEIGPTLSYSMGSDDVFLVSLIAINLSGHGYLYPWTFRELIDRAEAIEPIAGLMEGCRRLWPIVESKRTWPIDRSQPGRRVVKTRERMGKLWPYSRTDLPWDWFWGLGEG